MNWVDGVIAAAVVFYIIEGWNIGIFRLGTSLVAFVTSLWLAVRFHQLAGAFLMAKFGVPGTWSTVLGYAAVAVIAEIIINQLLGWAVTCLPKSIWTSAANRWLGAALSAAKGLVIVTLGLLLILALPLKGTVRADVNQSLVGGWLVGQVAKHGNGIKSSLDQATRQAIRFLTIKPASTERVNLDVAPTADQLQVSESAQTQMVQLVNQARVKAGRQPLKVSKVMTEIAGAYSQDLFTRRYFSHISPEGKDVGDRLQAAGIAYQEAGENLAYAPDVATAHQGLMDSEGHRKNILNPEFNRMGIGVIDAGVYGMMFTQVFTN